MQPLQYEFLICLSLENTEVHPTEQSRFIKSPSVFRCQSLNYKDHVIELAWSFYSTSLCKVVQEYHYLVKPRSMECITEEVLMRTRLEKDKIEKACGFDDVMNKFYETLLNHNSSSCLVVQGDWVIMGQLAYEADEYKIVMPHVFNSYINIFDTYEQYSSKKFTSLEQICKGATLKEMQSETPALENYQTLVRIVNKLIKQGYIFKVQQHFISHDLIEHLVNCMASSTTSAKQARERSRSRDQLVEYKWGSTALEYVRISNLPPGITKTDIALFLKGINIKYENIGYCYDDNSVFLDEVIVGLSNSLDAAEAIKSSKRKFMKSIIQVTKCLQADMIKAKESEARSTSKRMPEQPTLFPVKFRGLPFKLEYCDLEQFLSGYKFVADSIKFGIDEYCRKTGEAVVLMESEEEASRVLADKNKAHIQHRYIEIFKITSNEFSNFELQQKKANIILDSYINKENRNRIVKLTGLPFSVTVDEIALLFAEFQLVKKDIVIERKKGRATGCALCILQSNADAIKAKLELNKRVINKRYIEIRVMCDDD